MSRLLASLVFILLAIGCADPAKREAASVVAAVDRFRRAEYPGKPALLGPLKDVPCMDRDVCAAKDACVAHAEAMVLAITMKTEVQQRLDEPDAGPLDLETRAALLTKLDDASHLLDKGRTLQASCDQKTLELKMKYRF